MADQHLHLVFSKPPESVSDEEFNRWYDAHLDEILAVPGFRSAKRFRLEGIVNPEVSPTTIVLDVPSLISGILVLLLK